MSFEGTDYEELAQHWEIETDTVTLLRNHIHETMYNSYDKSGEYVDEKLDPRVKADMLDFLEEFVEKRADHKYGNGIFVGLIQLADEDDFSFAQYFVTLLPHMWV